VLLGIHGVNAVLIMVAHLSIVGVLVFFVVKQEPIRPLCPVCDLPKSLYISQNYNAMTN
jgi:hypothetical protein